MLTIAGGILLAVLAVYTAGIWLPILMWLLVAIFWLLIAAIVLGVGYAIVNLIIDYPQESIEFGAVIGVFSLFIFIIMRLQDWWIDKRRKKRNKRNKRNMPDLLEEFRDEFGEPGVLVRNKNKDQIIELARQFEIKVDANDTKYDIAKKLFDVKGEASEETLKAGINSGDGKDNVGGEGASLLEKIELAKEKEIIRINDEKKKAEEAKRKENELLAERFFTIKTALEELKLTYANDEDIDVSVSELSACLILGKFSSYSQREIQIEPNPYCEGFSVNDYDEVNRDYDNSEEVVDYIVELVGIFLAERESK